MLIVDPSFEILDEMDKRPLVERIEACGRICYKSEDKITSESAIPFVKKIVAHGHNSVMEMAAVTFKVFCDQEYIDRFFSCQPKYLIVHLIDGGMLVSGSLRAFREFYSFHQINEVAQICIAFLAKDEPYLFADIVGNAGADLQNSAIRVQRLSLAEVDDLAPQFQLHHRFVAVKFVVNRAVTHELVRHRPCSYLQESQRYCRYSHEKFGNQVTFIKPMFYEEGTSEYDDWKKAMEETEKIYLKLLETSTPQAARTVLPNSCKTEIITFCNLAEWKHIFSLRTTTHAEPSMREVMIPLQQQLSKLFPVVSFE